MIQQINLYQQGETNNTHLLLNPYLLAVMLTFLGLLTASIVAWQTVSDQENQSQQLQQQLQKTTAEVLMLQAQAPNQQGNTLLNQELQQSQTRYQSLSQIVEVLADNQSDLTQGFSRYLTALAAQTETNVWLNRIKINAVSNDISLQGSSTKPDLIPTLLQRLQNTDAFKEHHFARMDIRQSPTSPDQVDFSVSSSQEAEKEDAPKH